MKIRLGYVAMTLNLKDASPSGTITVTNYKKLSNDESKKYRLRKITEQNLRNNYRILLYNKALNIDVFRFTSKLVPLATFPLVGNWDYIYDFKELFKQIGDFVKENNFRVSAHPDHFTLINSTSESVLAEAIKDLDYHVKMLEVMGLEDYRYKLVMHIGGLYKDKENSLKRFKENFEKLPDRIRKRIILENDDKSYTALDVLRLCQELHVPMVVDIHHHNCVNNGESIGEMLPEIFDTWNNEKFVPKIHFSSPKSAKEFRSHADDINIEEFVGFLQVARILGRDFDVMIEAKNKDNALFKLSEELKSVDFVKVIDEGHIEVN